MIRTAIRSVLPCIALCVGASHYFWVDRADTAAVARATDYLENYRRPWEQKGVERFRQEMKNGRVVVFPAHHWMFITDSERTLQEVRTFLLEQ